MKSAANYISISRIVLTLVLLFLRPLSVEFFIVYFLCGLSDILDGYIARKTHTESKLGEKLDSAADLTMAAVLLYKFFPAILTFGWAFYWIIAILAVRVTSIIIVAIRYKIFGILHTIGNKLTGILLFLFPVIIQSELLIYIVLITAVLSAVEELLIHIVSKEFNANRKGIFDKR